MAIISYPYVSINGDRKRTATEIAEGLGVLATSGVSAEEGGLICTKVADSLQVSISVGKGFVAGHPMSSDAVEAVTLDAGDVTYVRHDIIVYEHNDNTEYRNGRFTCVKGTPAATPADPQLTQTSTIWQVPLCRVIVPKGAENLNSAILEDMREFSYGRHKHKTDDLDDEAVNTEKIAEAAVTGAKIASETVTGAKIASEAVTNTKIASEAVTNTKIASEAVTNTKIANSAVTEGKIANSAVTAAKIAINAVGSPQIANGAVGTSELGTINSITLDSGDTLTWSGNTLWLNVSGCTSVQLVPVVFGTSQNPPSGTYPKGTLYLTHEA